MSHKNPIKILYPCLIDLSFFNQMLHNQRVYDFQIELLTMLICLKIILPLGDI